jgi:CRISPR system Cascade subunit CasE
MSGGPKGLHLIRLRLHASRLFELGKRRGLPPRSGDLSYLVHCALGEAFGEGAPKPFAVLDDRGALVTVMGYSDRDVGSLQDHAKSFADPQVFNIVSWEHFEGKEMFTGFRAGQRVGFAVRASPIIRQHRKVDGKDKVVETDAFIAACLKVGKSLPVDRGAVYRGWLQNELLRRGGARLVSAELATFKLTRLLRRTQGEVRKAHETAHPEASFRGELEVTEPAAFSALLARGLGRHRSFGFGMVLLHAPGKVIAC